MIDFQLFIINLLCILGVSFIVFIILTSMNVDTNKSGISIFIAMVVVIAIYLWINIPQVACVMCNKHNFIEGMSNYNDDTPKFEYEQDGLIVPENIHGTMRTDINLDKFLKYGYMSKQLKAAMEYQKKYGGTNPPPSITATSQIVPPFSDVVIPVDPILLATNVPTVPISEIATNVPATIPETVEVPVEKFTNDDVKIMLFFSPHCGYCKDFMKHGGVWEHVKTEIRNKVEIIEVNSELNPQMCREFNVSYYPCLMKVKNNNIYEFNAERTYNNVKMFCLH